MLRMAYPQEKEALSAMWDLCFDEDSAFLKWFFNNRFIPAYCSVYERDGRIVGCAHSIQFNMRLRERILPCAIICGVATHPDYRRQGVGRAVMQHLMHTLCGYGVVLTPHRPQKLETYFSIGHYPMSDSMYIEEDAQHAFASADQTELINPRANLDLLYICYLEFAKRYSGIIQRSYADFLFKCEDYLSCDAKCLLYRKNGVPEGYCFYFETPDDLTGEELVANTEEAYQALYTALQRCAAGKTYVLRAACDAPKPNGGMPSSVVPRGVLGVANVSALLASLGVQGGAIEILDTAVPENAGIYTLSGQKTDQAPQLRIEAGRLAQWAVGYRSIGDIVASGDAELLDETILRSMERLAPCPCFIFDEY